VLRTVYDRSILQQIFTDSQGNIIVKYTNTKNGRIHSNYGYCELVHFMPKHSTEYCQKKLYTVAQIASMIHISMLLPVKVTVVRRV